MKQLLLLVLVLVSCQSRSLSLSVPCDQPGTLESGRVENENGLAHRFTIYLPPCYSAEPNRLYPTIYLFPGRSGGPNDWFNAGLADLADELILSRETSPFILVGLDNTDNDMQGENFLLRALPYIEANYRVNGDRQHRSLAGASQGGAPAYRLALQTPELFGSAALFGSGAIAGEEQQIQIWLDAIPSSRYPRFFFNTGFGDPYMLERAQAFTTILDGWRVEYESVFTDGDHSYAYWVDNFDEYLAWLAAGW
jgi:S-formylglutathione hydrolase FrmB